jgi:hypothetical protein
LNKPTLSLIRIGANNVTNNGIVFNNVVIKLKSIYLSAANKKPNENNPATVLTNNPDLDIILKVSFFV